MRADHVTYEGIFRLSPDFRQCAREGIFSLAAFLSVTDGDKRRVAFIRAQDALSLESELDSKQQEIAEIETNPKPEYAYLAKDRPLPKRDSWPPEFTSKVNLAKTAFRDTLAEVARRQMKGCDFDFWGDALPDDYRQYAYKAVGLMAQAAKFYADPHLARLDIQGVVHRYGLTEAIVDQALKQRLAEEKITPKALKRLKRTLKDVTFCDPNFAGLTEPLAVPDELYFLTKASCPWEAKQEACVKSARAKRPARERPAREEGFLAPVAAGWRKAMAMIL